MHLQTLATTINQSLIGHDQYDEAGFERSCPVSFGLLSQNGPPGCGELVDFLAGIVPFYFSVCYTGFRQPSSTVAYFPACRIPLKAHPALPPSALLHEPIFSFAHSKFVVSGGVPSMKCPFCKEEMVVGSISQDRYALKWVPAEKNMGLLNFTPLVKGIKLTSLLDGTAVKVFYCEPCRKFIIDQDDLRL